MSRLKAITLFRNIHIQIHTRTCTHMYTHVSKRINRREMIYLPAKGLPTPRNVEIPQWTANCAPKSNLNCFQNCIQGRIAHEVSFYFFSLMGIYWLYPLSNPCSGACVLAVAFLGCFPLLFLVFTVWNSQCISYFFLPKFHTAFLWLRFLSKYLWRHVFYSPSFFKFLCVFIVLIYFGICIWRMWLIWRTLNLQ